MERVPQSIDDIRRLVVSTEFFNQMDSEQIEAIVNHTDAFDYYSQGEVIIEQGDKGQALYLLMVGEVRIEVGKPAQIVTFIHPGDFFGEIGFATHKQRIASAIANKASILWRLDAALLEKFDCPLREKIYQQIINKLSRALDQTNQQLISWALV